MAERFLVLAPRGRDSAIVVQVFERGGIVSRVCADLAELRAALDGDVGGVLVTEEALAGPGLEALPEWVGAQPPWSDLPVIVLATRQAGRRAAEASRLLERLGNVVLLERPINAETLTSAAGSALRARRRQYQTRRLLLERQDAEAELRRLNETLEQRVEERTRALEAASRTLTFALASAGMGSWDLDLRTDTSRRSPQHDRIFGFPTGIPNWSRGTFLAAVVEADRPATLQAFERAVGTGILELDCRINRPDGTMRWIAVKGRVEYDPAGVPIRMAGIVSDTTERRQTEDALHQAQKMEAIGQLTGGVAHDFNNLLTVIVGGLDMMIRKPERTDRVVRLAEAAMTAARRGEQLTQQLLAFSRRQLLRPETLDPCRLLHGFQGLAQRAVGAAVELRFALDPVVHPIRIDPAQFESAVLNLIVNARDAIDGKGDGGGTITVRCGNAPPRDERLAERKLSPGNYVMVSVSDTGSGFDAATLARAFEPFFTTKDIGKGSGLGLSQVYGFMRSAGGDAAIESAPGAGTTVRLYFPRSADAAIEERPVQAAALREAAGDETVLLVEDDEEVLGMAIESLEELRYTVVVSRNAREALEQLKGPGRIDLMFSDVVMPGGMNGARLALEAQRLRPGLKILLTSGYVAETDAGQVVGEGLPVLNKPYRRDELARTLRVVLGRG